MKRDIIKAIQRASGVDKINLETPETDSHGDYSTNVAMQTSTKAPKKTAEKIVEKLRKDKELEKIVSKVEVAGPGFINFWLSQEVLLSNLYEVKEGYVGDGLKGRKIL